MVSNPPGDSSHRPPTGAEDVFIARQPILDVSRRVVGYELLFRASGTTGAFSGKGEQATACVITDSLLSFGLDTLTHGRLAFVNLTRAALLDDIPSVMPPDRVVLELLEDIEADPDVMDRCRALKRDGYAIALDDFAPAPATLDLVSFADYVKVDFQATPDLSGWIRGVAAARSGAPPAFVAERIETPADHQRATEAGFTHFQGFFLGRPATQRTRRIPEAQLGYLRLLQALRDPDLTLDEMEELIKPDAALCVRVLRTVNSAAFALRTEVGSIREALVMLGRDPVRRWVSVWAMASLARGSHSELLLASIVRARLCEILGASGGDETRAAQGFLLGVCSLLDAIFDAPMDAIVARLPLDESLKAALSGDDNPPRRLLDAVIAYERGDWCAWPALAERAGLRLADFSVAAADAFRWASGACDSGALDADR